VIGARAVGPDRDVGLQRRRGLGDRAHCGVEFGGERRLRLGVDHLLPVDHAVDEVDRGAVRRERHQDAAIERRAPAGADELGLEADRRAIGDDLEIMVGQPRQQRSARHLGDASHRAVERALLAQRPSEIRDRRILGAAGEIEQHAVRPEVGDPGRLEILYIGIGPRLQQRHPVIVRADMHATLVAAEIEHLVRHRGIDRIVDGDPVIVEIARAIHASEPSSLTGDMPLPKLVHRPW
jgi:hypothetical protein